MASRRPTQPVIDAPAYASRNGQKPLELKKLSLPAPDRMEAADYDLFVYLHQQRLNALIRSIATIPMETLLPLIQTNGGDPNALAEIKNQSTGIDLLKRRYALDDGDEIQTDGSISRRPQE